MSGKRINMEPETYASDDIKHVLQQIADWVDVIADDTPRTSQGHLYAIQTANLIRRAQAKLRYLRLGKYEEFETIDKFLY